MGSSAINRLTITFLIRQRQCFRRPWNLSENILLRLWPGMTEVMLVRRGKKFEELRGTTTSLSIWSTDSLQPKVQHHVGVLLVTSLVLGKNVVFSLCPASRLPHFFLDARLAMVIHIIFTTKLDQYSRPPQEQYTVSILFAFQCLGHSQAWSTPILYWNNSVHHGCNFIPNQLSRYKAQCGHSYQGDLKTFLYGY